MSQGHRNRPPLPSVSDEIPVEVEEGDFEEAANSTPTVRALAITADYLSQVPRVAVSPEELNAADLDHREYFLLSLLDGMTSVENLLDICGMPGEEALALLDGLVRRGLVGMPG